jgi:DNA-directed RNA polymerase subunit omega
VARITVEDCLEEIDNRFLLVHLAALRAKQLRKGSNPMVDSPENKEVVRALREIAAGKVTTENIDELSVPEEDLFESYQEEEREEIIESPEDELDENEKEIEGQDEE